MKLLSEIIDERINSKNLLFDVTVEEYLSFANKILQNNDFQRNKVRSLNTIYALLADDYLKGCIIPPIVLATTENISKDEYSKDDFYKYISDKANNFMILDGLQRTYTMLEAEKKAQDELEKFKKRVMRIEVYVDINRFGILYRMLTLNTGQTPMSMRHQIEMLYSDLKESDIEGVRLVTDKEGKANPNKNEIKFVDAIEGFSSYMCRSELKMDRTDILDNIKMLEKISIENMNKDIFESFINLYVELFNAMNEIADNDSFEDDLKEIDLKGNPFGKNSFSIFASSQSLTGFGAALGKMIDRGVVENFEKAHDIINKVREKNNGNEGFISLIDRLDRISHSAKKIGNDQRMYFAYFYRELFNEESDSFADIMKAAETGYEKYYSQVS